MTARALPAAIRPVALIVATVWSSSLAFIPSAVQAKSIRELPGTQAFIDEMVASHQFDAAWLEGLLARAEYQRRIIAAISSPAEAKPWHRYRRIFLTPERIQGGLQFWNLHAAELARAERQFGVPAEVVVAILGVETSYGRNRGSYRVLDALSTLAFDYPKRSRFFRGELEQFLLLSREERVDPLALYGSYAGAMGWPQFISSSYRRYAVDFDGDGKRDLWENPVDAIGSVANYLEQSGWERGQPITAQAQVQGTGYRRLITKELRPRHTLGRLRQAGVSFETPSDRGARASLIELDSEAGPEYWVGMPNFYVITRYNRSNLYAMAVFQLGEEIRRSRQASFPQVGDGRIERGGEANRR